MVYEISADYQTVTEIKPNGTEWAGGTYDNLQIGPNGIEGMVDANGKVQLFVAVSFQTKTLYKIDTSTTPYKISEV